MEQSFLCALRRRRPLERWGVCRLELDCFLQVVSHTVLYHGVEIRGSVPFLARSKTFHFGNLIDASILRSRDARVVSDPRGASASPGRHVADLTHHACITYGRPVDARRPTTLAGRSAQLRPRRRQPAQLRRSSRVDEASKASNCALGDCH